jgi:hypothetical protein
MLSFDVSAIDIVLLIAVIVLLVLFIQKKGQASTTPPLSVQAQDELPEKTELKSQKAKKKLTANQSHKGFHECAHSFGYLKDLPKNTPVPNECFGCPQVMRCLFTSEQDQLAQ